MIKILLWAPLGAGTHYWGPGTNIYRLYKCLKDNNVEITLVHGSSKQEIYPDVFVNQIALPYYDTSSYLDKIKYFYVGRKWLLENYKNYDVFHGISAYQTTFYFAKLFFDLGKPAFVKMTGEQGGFGDSSFISRLLGIAKWRMSNINNITGYISISETITKNLKARGVEENKIFAIPNGVDVERFCLVNLERKNKLRDKYKLANKITISYVGGLTLNKRVIELVQAVKKLNDNDFDVQLLLVGPDRSGSDNIKDQIYAFIKDNKLERSVFHFEHTILPEEFYQITDIYVLNSISEGMPNSLLEAMSCGVCSIVTPISGSKDLVKDGVNGLYVNGTVEDLVDKISKVIEDESLRSKFGVSSLQIIKKFFSAESVLDMHVELFGKHINN